MHSHFQHILPPKNGSNGVLSKYSEFDLEYLTLKKVHDGSHRHLFKNVVGYEHHLQTHMHLDSKI